MEPKELADHVTNSLQDWSQGDYHLMPSDFPLRFAPAMSLTVPQKFIDLNPGIDLVDTEVIGLCILTQTCDLMKRADERPFVEVAPLVALEQVDFEQVKKRMRPQYAILPAEMVSNIAVDLDRITSLEKPVLLNWNRKIGCTTIEEKLEFARALARKRNRPAFQNEFHDFTKRFRRRCKEKILAETAEGKALRLLKEIRVYADWKQSRPHIEFYFLFDKSSNEVDLVNLQLNLKDLFSRLPHSTSRYTSECFVTSYDGISASTYLASEPMDMESVS